MGGTAIGTAKNITAGGLKLSAESVQLCVTGRVSPAGDWERVLQRLTQARLNLSMFCADAGPPAQACLCLAPRDLARCRAVTDGLAPGLRPRQGTSGMTGTVTVFPHQGSVAVLGGVVLALARRNLPIHAVCTSLSGVSAVTDYALLDQAADAISEVIDFPRHAAPIRPEPLVFPPGIGSTGVRRPIETTAVYWERQIRTYGIARLADSCLTAGIVTVDALPMLGEILLNHGGTGGKLAMAVIQRIDKWRYRLVFVGSGDPLSAAGKPGLFETVQEQVAVIYLHGPHFQDRFGVAHAALAAMLDRNLSPLAISCTGSSIYLAVPEKSADLATASLTERFIVPNV